ncbi:MAG: DUF2339 domain-containing protein [Verrucomicrobiota bacterium]
MNESIVFVLLLVIGAPVLVVIWLITRALDARSRLEDLSFRLDRLESDVSRLKSPVVQNVVEQPPKAAPAPPPVPKVEPQVARPVPAPAPLVPPPAARPAAPATPSYIRPIEPEPVRAFAKTASPINWEQFMGVKLFAWAGGLALFLGVAFFVKYSFDNNLVPPELRAATGFLAGLGLLVGGVLMSRKNYPALSQTLCATGVVILYAVTFACRSIYHFQFFGPVPTFLFMVLVTTAAFMLAIRLDALVIAILGMLGGFLTPPLLSTGQDNPFGLFGYIAILDAGLVLVALHRRWFFLTALGAFATALMEIGWAGKFFVAEKYFDGNKIFTALAVVLGFQLLFLAANGWGGRRQQDHGWLAGAALGLAATALAFAGWFLTFAPLAQRPALMFSFVFLIDSAVAALVLLDNRTVPAQSVAGLAVFALLGYWTAHTLNNELLNTALVFYFVFAVWHAVFPLLLQRRFGLETPLWAGQVFPALALLLVLVPIFKFDEISFIVWPFVFLVDSLAVVLAVLLGSMLSVMIVLILTLAATGALIFKIPVTLASLSGPSLLVGACAPLVLLGAFAVFFVAAGVWLLRWARPAASTGGKCMAGGDLTAQLPVLSAVLPFLLLIMAAVRLPLADPSPIFGLALLLAVLLLGVAKLLSIDLLPAVGLVCVTAVECAWHFSRFDPANAGAPLVWYLALFAVFTIYPFVFLRQFAAKTIPWAAAAMAGVPQFFLIHRLMAAAHPNQFMGLLPMAFAIPPLTSLVIVLRKIPADNPARLTQLAWFGGAALFFITLVFPIQFDRQWIPIGWALEGVALMWLFHRVPHPGLRLAGAGLLVASFVRLALNPAVLEYHTRSAAPILNWYLYAYGAVTVCLFAGARLVAPPRNRVGQVNAPPVLAGLGTVLAFLLLNIEIADYFSAPGSTLTFQFGGNFGREMTYTIAWAVFALVLLVAGILRKIPISRYAALALLSVTLLKLFFHDLSQLGALYRIGAFIAVAVIAMLASFAYQRFFAAASQQKERIEPAP